MIRGLAVFDEPRARRSIHRRAAPLRATRPIASWCVHLAPLLVGLVALGCVPVAYVDAPDTTFAIRTPRGATFDRLYRRAVELGYVISNVDTPHTTFTVHSRVQPRRRRRRSRYFAYGGRYGVNGRATNATQLVVEVTDRSVRVRAIGSLVRDDGTIHPSVADEIRELETALEQASTRVHVNPLADVPAAYAGALPPPRGAAQDVDPYSRPAPQANVPIPYTQPENPLEPAPNPQPDTTIAPSQPPPARPSLADGLDDP